MKRKYFSTAVFCGVFGIVLLLNFGCDQYNYVSPSPGIVELLFRTKSNEITFSPLNSFILTIPQNGVQARREDGALLQINEDVFAIARKQASYNILQPEARDSILVLGEAFAPPGNYSGIEIQFTPGGYVILDGYRTIPVFAVNSNGGSYDLNFQRPFTIASVETTYVTLTIDLDQSLVKGAENYYFLPYYNISSIESYRGASVSGYVFNDVNGNSTRDAGEPGLEGWQINLSGGKIDSTLTTSTGLYSFSGLKPRSYMITEQVPAEWVETFPTLKMHVIPLKSGQVQKGLDFGNFYLGSN